MPKFLPIASCLLGALSLSFLVGCSDNSVAIKPPISSHNTSVAATQKLESSDLASPSPKTSVAQVPTVQGNLLDASQKMQLQELAVPIVIPTYLPEGFRLVKLDSGKEELRSGSYAYYSILYRGENDTCLDISLNTDPAMLTSRMPRRFMQIPISQKEVTIIYGKLEDKPITLGRFGVANGAPHSSYMLRTGGWMPSDQEGRNIRCNSINESEYDKILRVLEVMNAKQ